MMNDQNLWYDGFIEILYKKYPKKSQLTEKLMDLLSIEREAIYRRLRKDIIFPIHELAKIASEWNISLDEIVGIESGEIIFRTKLLNYLDPSDEDLSNIRKLLHLDEFKDVADMEYMEVSNKLPRALTSGFLHLDKYQLLKWAYQYANEEKTLPFSQILYPEKLTELLSDYHATVKNVANTSFVWDFMIFNYLVCGIRYFHSIYLITNEEKELIKKDLYALLDYMLEVAAKGCWLETSNKVNLYISHMNIDTNYSYYYSDELKKCSIHVFSKNEIHTNDLMMVENFRNWMQSKKKSAIQISKSNEKSRIAFFVEQRKLIDTL